MQNLGGNPTPSDLEMYRLAQQGGNGMNNLLLLQAGGAQNQVVPNGSGFAVDPLNGMGGGQGMLMGQQLDQQMMPLMPQQFQAPMLNVQQIPPQPVPQPLHTDATPTPSPSESAKKPTKKRKRRPNKKACVSCSKSKVKCDGQDPNPCSRCADRDMPCVYEKKGKRGPKKKKPRISLPTYDLPLTLQRKIEKDVPRHALPIHILLCATGSVAAIKVPEIAELLLGMNYEINALDTEKKPVLISLDPHIKCILSKNAQNFVTPKDIVGRLEQSESIIKKYKKDLKVEETMSEPNLKIGDSSDIPDWLSQRLQFCDDEQDWRLWQKKGDPVFHIELRKWAHIMFVAPLTANTMAKMANGLCDNLATNVFRAWDPIDPVVICPAMNTMMWKNPLTSQQLTLLKKYFNISVVDPISKKLACGDTGVGALATPEACALGCLGQILNQSFTRLVTALNFEVTETKQTKPKRSKKK